ncbi:MAG: hypothetical protein VKJ66_08350 [Synechococcus sp.]|nr:hypothetical protein [Synechococcus sp.]
MQPKSIHPRRRLPLAGALLVGLASGAPALAEPQGWSQPYGMSKQERDLLDYGPGSGKGDSILDSTNPLDLMNKIRKGSALDDATPPGDAVDQALRDFDAQQTPGASGASRTVTAP